MGMTREAVYYLVGNGLGNVIQTIPAYNYLRAVHTCPVVLCAYRQYTAFATAIYSLPVLPVERFPLRGKQRASFTNVNPSTFVKCGGVSEVVANLKLVGCDNPTDVARMGTLSICPAGPITRYDILICDGYNKRTNAEDWLVKSYPYWADVVAKLSDNYRIASIGLPDEYIDGTVDETTTSMTHCFELISAAKLVISNDTGFYHAACALGIPCLVIFTMTDTDKNYDPVFHRSANIIAREDLPCRPCQLNGGKYWITNKPVCHWQCRDVPPQTIINAAETMLNG
jgi:hypothetical protein